MARIFFIGGGKGGVGKSLMAMIALHYFIKSGKSPILIETDTANPDVFKAYDKKCAAAYAFDIDTEKGWVAALNVIGEHLNDDTPIIINSGARNDKTIVQFGSVLNDIPDITTLWMINDQLDSLVLLKEYLQTVKTPVCAIKNGFFGDPDKFSVFDQSGLCKNGLPSVYLPKATEAIAKKLYVDRLALHELNGNLSFGDKLLANSWMQKASDTFNAALSAAVPYKG